MESINGSMLLRGLSTSRSQESGTTTISGGRLELSNTDSNEIVMNMAENDCFRLRCSGETNAGNVEFATADDGNEGFYFRQYKYLSGGGGVHFHEVKRELCLLGKDGNTTLPGNLKINTTSDTGIESLSTGNYSMIKLGKQEGRDRGLFGFRDTENSYAYMTTNITDKTAEVQVKKNSIGIAGGKLNFIDNSANEIVMPMAKNDAFRIRCTGETDNGEVELAVSDNNNGPIYVRQYSGDGETNGSFNAVTRELCLLDADGNTILPGSLTVNGNINGPITINTTVDVGLSMITTDDYNAIRLGKRNGDKVMDSGALFAYRYHSNDPFAYVRLTDTGSPEFRIKKTAIEFTGGKLRLTNTNANEIVMPMADDDHFRIKCDGASNEGAVELATSDNGNEAIYVRQYSRSKTNDDGFHEIKHELCLLDANGDTSMSGNLSVTGNVTANSAFTAKQNVSVEGDLSIGVNKEDTTTVSIGSSTAITVNQTNDVLNIINNTAANGKNVALELGNGTATFQGNEDNLVRVLNPNLRSNGPVAIVLGKEMAKEQSGSMVFWNYEVPTIGLGIYNHNNIITYTKDEINLNKPVNMAGGSLKFVDTSINEITMNMAGTDHFRIRCSGENNGGNVEFASADDGTEGFYFRQCKSKDGDKFGKVERELILLGPDGHTTIPGIVNISSGDHRPLRIFCEDYYKGEPSIQMAIGKTYNQCAFFGFSATPEDKIEYSYAYMHLNNFSDSDFGKNTPSVKTWRDKITLELGDVYVDKNLSVTGNVTASNLYTKDGVDTQISNAFNKDITINAATNTGLQILTPENVNYSMIKLGKNETDERGIFGFKYDAANPYVYARTSLDTSPEFRIEKDAFEFTGGRVHLTDVDTSEILMNMAGTDRFRIRCSGENDGGNAEFATADDGTEGFYFRQYKAIGDNKFGEVNKELVLMGPEGNTVIPGTVTIKAEDYLPLRIFRDNLDSTDLNERFIRIAVGKDKDNCAFFGYGNIKPGDSPYIYIKHAKQGVDIQIRLYETGCTLNGGPFTVNDGDFTAKQNASVKGNLTVDSTFTAKKNASVEGDLKVTGTISGPTITDLQTAIESLQSNTVTHRTNVFGLMRESPSTEHGAGLGRGRSSTESGEIGTFCETNGGIYDGYEKIDQTDCICQVIQSTTLNPKIVGIICSEDRFASHGDVLVKVVPGTYQLGDILCPDITGKARVATDTEMQYMMLHAIPRPKITSLATGIPNVVACFIV